MPEDHTTRHITVQDSQRIASSESVGVSGETWADWFPAAELTLTINDMVTGLHHRGVDDATVANIRMWQRDRVLPLPIRRQVGMGKGQIRALYPPQAIDVIARLRGLQREGKKLREIGPQLRREFVDHALTGSARGTSHAHGNATLHVTAASAAAQANLVTMTTSDRVVPQTTAREQENPEFLEVLAAEARQEAHRVGAPIREVELTFTDARGKKHTRTIPLDTGV
jgi:hypothetical protein